MPVSSSLGGGPVAGVVASSRRKLVCSDPPRVSSRAKLGGDRAVPVELGSDGSARSDNPSRPDRPVSERLAGTGTLYETPLCSSPI